MVTDTINLPNGPQCYPTETAALLPHSFHGCLRLDRENVNFVSRGSAPGTPSKTLRRWDPCVFSCRVFSFTTCVSPTTSKWWFMFLTQYSFTTFTFFFWKTINMVVKAEGVLGIPRKNNEALGRLAPILRQRNCY